MTFARLQRLPVLGAALLGLACGGDGGGGGTTEPPGPPTQLAISGGDNQDWYFNNPLPVAYSVTVRDANNRAVPGVPVDWSFTTGDGTLSEDPSTTNASGVATTTHTLGLATTYVVTASVSGVASTATFTASASAPPTSGAVSVDDDIFIPRNIDVKVQSTVTWTWVGSNPHSVTFPGGPTSATQTTGPPYERTFTSTGTFNYICLVHANMNGSVTVVN